MKLFLPYSDDVAQTVGSDYEIGLKAYMNLTDLYTLEIYVSCIHYGDPRIFV
jgi:hypothetical protein